MGLSSCVQALNMFKEREKRQENGIHCRAPDTTGVYHGGTGELSLPMFWVGGSSILYPLNISVALGEIDSDLIIEQIGSIIII